MGMICCSCYLERVKLFHKVGMAIDLSKFDRVQVGAVPEVRGLSGAGAFEQHGRQPFEAVAGGEVKQGRKFAQI